MTILDSFRFFRDDREWEGLRRHCPKVDLPDGREVDGWPVAMIAASELASDGKPAADGDELVKRVRWFFSELADIRFSLDDFRAKCDEVAGSLWDGGVWQT
jgi:hypothetical protein